MIVLFLTISIKQIYNGIVMAACIAHHTSLTLDWYSWCQYLGSVKAQ